MEIESENFFMIKKRKIRKKMYRKRKRATSFSFISPMGRKVGASFFWLLLLSLLSLAVWIQRGPILKKAKALPFFKVASVVVEGASFVPRDSLLVLCPIKPGMSFWSHFNFKRIGHQLTEVFLWAEKVEVHKNMFGRVTLKVTERKPFAVISGKFAVAVDSSGTLLGSQTAVPGTQPVLSGVSSEAVKGLNWGEQITDKQALKGLNLLCRIQDQFPELSRNISELFMLNSKESILYMMHPNSRLRIKNSSWKKGLAIYQSLPKKEAFFAEADWVDLRFSNLIFLKSGRKKSGV